MLQQERQANIASRRELNTGHHAMQLTYFHQMTQVAQTSDLPQCKKTGLQESNLSVAIAIETTTSLIVFLSTWISSWLQIAW